MASTYLTQTATNVGLFLWNFSENKDNGVISIFYIYLIIQVGGTCCFFFYYSIKNFSWSHLDNVFIWFDITLNVNKLYGFKWVKLQFEYRNRTGKTKISNLHKNLKIYLFSYFSFLILLTNTFEIIIIFLASSPKQNIGIKDRTDDSLV
jgi:hypothetical protein